MKKDLKEILVLVIAYTLVFLMYLFGILFFISFVLVGSLYMFKFLSGVIL